MTTIPALWLNGSDSPAGASGGAIGGSGSIQNGYAELVGAGIFPAAGAKVFRMWSSLIDAASMRLVQAGVETVAVQQQNLQLLKAIADYCNANGIVVSIEDDFEFSPLWAPNWAATAASVGLPVTYVDGGEHLYGVADNPTALTKLASTMLVNAKAIQSYFPKVQFGDVEPAVAAPSDQSGWAKELKDWWAIYNKTAAANGVSGFSYYTADIPWDQGASIWRDALASVGQSAKSAGLSFGVFVNGANSVTSEGWADYAEQHVAQIATDQAINPDFLVLETWCVPFPSSVTPIDSPGTIANIACNISLVYPAYQAGYVSANQGIVLKANAQAIASLGVPIHLGISAVFGLSDNALGASAAITLISETGTLFAETCAGGHVTGSGTGHLVLTGSPNSLNAELATVTATEGIAGPATVEVQAYNRQGVAATYQINIVALDPKSASNTSNTRYSFSGSIGTSWTSSSVTFTKNHKIASETLSWRPTDFDPVTKTYNTVHTVLAFSPTFDPDIQMSGGHLINPNAQSNRQFQPLEGEAIVGNVISTSLAFNASTGAVQSILEMIAPDATLYAAKGYRVSPFHTGGSAITQINDGSNPSWDPTWSTSLASIECIKNSSGQLFEQILVWKPGNQFTYSMILDAPQSGHVWQRIDVLAVPTARGADEVVTEFNTDSNPDWDKSDWGNAVSVAVAFRSYMAESEILKQLDGSKLIRVYNIPDAPSQWNEHMETINSAGQLVFDDYFWKAGGLLCTSRLTYIAQLGRLSQRWDVPSVGGYIDTQFDTTGRLPYAYFVQTVDSANHLVSLIYHYRTATDDFNGDGRSEFLIQNDDGSVATWAVSASGGASATKSVVGSNPGASWHVVGSGDCNGDGRPDILWQNNDGSVMVWLDNAIDTGPLTCSPIATNPGPSWHVKGSADFNGDGHADILWQNDNGTAVVWLMNASGNGLIGSAMIASNPGPSWHIKAAADFNGDGHADILWQNDNGSAVVWLMNASGNGLIGSAMIGSNPGSSWHIKGAADFNGDGHADILWQNDNGSVAVWLMDASGTGPTSGSVIGNNPGLAWHVKGSGDFNGDGRSDILLQNDNGTMAAWLMNAAGTGLLCGGNTIGINPGASWNLMGSDRMHFISGTSTLANLTGTPGPDEFIFASYLAGPHVINDFLPSQDIIELSKAQFGSFASMQQHSTPSGGGALIALDHSSSLLLTGVSPAGLHSTNFVFA